MAVPPVSVSTSATVPTVSSLVTPNRPQDERRVVEDLLDVDERFRVGFGVRVRSSLRGRPPPER